MPWDRVMTNWLQLVEPLVHDFPHMSKIPLWRFRGDRQKLVVYLAETHDLTHAEADEALTDWVTFVAPKFKEIIAA